MCSSDLLYQSIFELLGCSGGCGARCLGARVAAIEMRLLGGVARAARAGARGSRGGGGGIHGGAREREARAD